MTTVDNEQPDREQAFLAAYDSRAFPKPSVTVDVVALTVLDADLKALLIRRDEPPFQDTWALPGGFVRVGPGDRGGEDLIEAARRELAEETHLGTDAVELRQLGVFGAPGRDPRTRVITVAWWGGVRPELSAFVRAGTDASAVRWCSLASIQETPLAFDHQDILEAGVRRLREELHDGADRSFTAETFTVAELRAVHEVVGGTRLDPGNFRRRFLARVDAEEAELVTEASPGAPTTRGRRYRWRSR